MDAWLSTGCDGSYYNAAVAERLSAKKSCGPQAPRTSPAPQHDNRNRSFAASLGKCTQNGYDRDFFLLKRLRGNHYRNNIQIE